MTDEEFLEALDLLDSLVDPLLDLGPCKGRVTAWKKMMRDRLANRGLSARDRERENVRRLKEMDP